MSDHGCDDEAYASALITYTTRGDTHQSATMAPTEGCGFLDVLGVAQSLKIDFLPLTWQPALGIAGEGGTATISQASMNIQLAFVFKQFKCPLSPIEEVQSWHALRAEISILGHPAVRRHPSIVSIEGICWDVDASGEKVWPVLVFEKARCGDLKRFMTTDAGKALSIKARLNILFDVAYAVRDLHACNVIHGDIKPENILVFCENENHYVAKVTDFGYSTMFARESDSISMPYSKYWTAPEHHHRGFTPMQARQMDAYSFGMLCLWLAFDRTMVDRADNIREYSEILEEYTPGLNEKSLHSSDQVNYSLHTLFKLSLSKDPTQRTADFSSFLELLSCRFQVLAPPLNNLTISLKSFQMPLSIPQFLDAHYSLRSYITKCLEERKDSPTINNHDVLNLALCYELGFGARRDTMKSRKIIEETEIPIRALEDAIEQLKMDLQPSEFHEGRFMELFEQRQALELDYSHQYRKQHRVAEAEIRYQDEIEALGSVFGADHRLVLKIKLQLFLLLSNEERWNDAENVLVPMIDSTRQGTDEGHTGRLIPYLAAIYRKQGRLKEAEELDMEIVQINEKVWGVEHPQTLINKTGLASTYRSQGWLKEAEKLELEVIETSEKVLGTEHEITMVGLGNLLSTYYYQGRWKDAEELALRVVEINKRALGAEDLQTLTNIIYLASIYRKQERLKEAEEAGKHVLETSKKVLGREHPQTLNSMANLAETYWTQGRLREAEELEVQVMETSKSVFGENHQDTLKSMANLQWYQDARYKESEMISRSWIANVWRRGKERLRRE